MLCWIFNLNVHVFHWCSCLKRNWHLFLVCSCPGRQFSRSKVGLPRAPLADFNGRLFRWPGKLRILKLEKLGWLRWQKIGHVFCMCIIYIYPLLWLIGVLLTMLYLLMKLCTYITYVTYILQIRCMCVSTLSILRSHAQIGGEKTPWNAPWEKMRRRWFRLEGQCHLGKRWLSKRIHPKNAVWEISGQFITTKPVV